MKARIVLILGVLVLTLAAFAPAASAVSGYGPEECESEGAQSTDNNVVDCDPDPCKDADGAKVTDPKAVDADGEPCNAPIEVESGAIADPVVQQAPESAKLAYTGSSTQLMVLLASGLIAGGTLLMFGTRRLGRR